MKDNEPRPEAREVFLQPMADDSYRIRIDSLAHGMTFGYLTLRGSHAVLAVDTGIYEYNGPRWFADLGLLLTCIEEAAS